MPTAVMPVFGEVVERFGGFLPSNRGGAWRVLDWEGRGLGDEGEALVCKFSAALLVECSAVQVGDGMRRA